MDIIQGKSMLGNTSRKFAVFFHILKRVAEEIILRDDIEGFGRLAGGNENVWGMTLTPGCHWHIFSAYRGWIVCLRGKKNLHSKIRLQANRNGRRMAVFQYQALYLERSTE